MLKNKNKKKKKTKISLYLKEIYTSEIIRCLEFALKFSRKKGCKETKHGGIQTAGVSR